MKTQKSLFILATLLCCTGLTACGDGIRSSFEDFEELCVFSGGTVVNASNKPAEDNSPKYCQCGTDTCAIGVVCIEGKCADSVEKKCNENQEPYCEDDSLYSCDNGILVQTPCPNGCLNNECRDCNDGDTKCEDDGIKTCKDGVWGESDNSCGDNGCLSDKSACAECREDETPCSDGQYQLCVAGRLSTQKISCASGICAQDGTSCADCRDSETQCDSASTYRQCIDGKWTESQGCGEKLCNDGQCVDSCTENATLCINGKISTCIDSKWNVPKACGNSVSCKNTSACGECENTKKKCENSYISICENGEWVKANPCSKCNDAGTECNLENDNCNEGKIKCADGKIKECNGGKWNDIETCQNGCNGAGTECNLENDNCNEGEIKCADAIVQKCVEGMWKKLSKKNSCITDESIHYFCKPGDELIKCNACDAGNCIECDGKEQKCENGKNMICTLGHWGSGGNACGNKCTDGTKSCTDGKIKECVSGNWSVEKNCPNNNSCNEDGSGCGKCKNDDTKCVSDNAEDVEYTCVNGQWDNLKKCEYGCNANNKFCEVKPIDNCTGMEPNCATEKLITKCVKGKLQNIPCASEESCIDEPGGAYCGVCKNGENNCENGFSYSCQNGDWNRILSNQCKNGCDEAFGSCSEELKEGLQCYSGFPDKCDSDNNIYSCVNGNLENKGMCYDKGNVGQYCYAGTVIDCIDKVSCNSSGSACGECLNGTVCKISNSGAMSTVKYKKCDNGVYKKCSSLGSGDFSDTISCVVSETADYPECPQ